MIINQLTRIPQKEKNNADNGGSGDAAAPVTGSNPDGGDAQSSGSGEDTALNPAERSLLQKVFGNMISMKCIYQCLFHHQVIRKGLVEIKNDLEVQRRDPKSPLHSVKTFEALNLKPSLLKGVYGMGFNAPSKIQVGRYLVPVPA